MRAKKRPIVVAGSKVVIARLGDEVRVLCNRTALRVIRARIDWMLAGDPQESYELDFFWDMNSGDMRESPVVRGGVGPRDVSLAFSENVNPIGPNVTIHLLPDGVVDEVFEVASVRATQTRAVDGGEDR